MQEEKKPIKMAYRILTARLVIRCYNPGDAPLLQQSVQESAEHLKPWMPWAHEEPTPLEERVQRLRGWRAKFDLDQEYVFGIFNKDETRLVGGTGFHPRVGPDAMEIGYWINVHEVRKGYCTEAVRALMQVGFDVLGLRRLEVHCNPKNVASAAVPRKLGYVHDATLRNRVPNEKGELRDSMVWSMLAEEYARLGLRDARIVMLDCTGQHILQKRGEN